MRLSHALVVADAVCWVWREVVLLGGWIAFFSYTFWIIKF